MQQLHDNPVDKSPITPITHGGGRYTSGVVIYFALVVEFKNSPLRVLLFSDFLHTFPVLFLLLLVFLAHRGQILLFVLVGEESSRFLQ